MPITAVGSGISGQLLYLPEATWGVNAGGAGFASGRPLEFKSETLALHKTTVQGQGLHASGLYDRTSRRVLTNYDAGGVVTFDLPNRNLNILLQNMTGSPNTLVAGAAALVPPTQIAATAAYQSYHSPGNTQGISMSWQKGVPTVDTAGPVVEPFTYVGCKISDWEITVETGAIAQLVLTIDARNELGGTGNGDPLNGSVPTLGAFSETSVNTATDPLNVYHFRQATLFTGGTPTLTAGVLTMPGSSAAANVKSFSCKESHSLDSTRYFLGSSGFKAEQIENGFRSVTGQMIIEWLSAETMYNAFAGDTNIGLTMTLTGGIAGTSGANHDTLQLILPTLKLDGESPVLGGPSVVTQSATYTALDDNLTSPYQFQYISSDSAI